MGDSTSSISKQGAKQQPAVRQTPLTDALVTELWGVARIDMRSLYLPKEMIDHARRMEADRAELIEVLQSCRGCDLIYDACDKGLDGPGTVADVVDALLAKIQQSR